MGKFRRKLRNRGLDDLMTTQQRIAFASARGRIGQTVEVLIDRPSDKKGRWIGRTAGQAPEIDSVTCVVGPDLHAGKLVSTKVSGSDGYDLVAEIPKARSLKVVS